MNSCLSTYENKLSFLFIFCELKKYLTPPRQATTVSPRFPLSMSWGWESSLIEVSLNRARKELRDAVAVLNYSNTLG